MELGALAKLMERAHSDFIEEAIKALYAISALIRNNPEGQQLFYKEAGDLMLQVKTLKDNITRWGSDTHLVVSLICSYYFLYNLAENTEQL